MARFDDSFDPDMLDRRALMAQMGGNAAVKDELAPDEATAVANRKRMPAGLGGMMAGAAVTPDRLAPDEATATANRARTGGNLGAMMAGLSARPGGVPAEAAAGGYGPPAVQRHSAPGAAPAAPAGTGFAPADDAAPRPKTSTSLMEGEANKLASPEHIAKSPKYQFLSKAQEYGRGQEGELLQRLQTEHPEHWAGWAFDGKGNFVNDGTTPLHPAWGGVRKVDAYGGYQAGGDLKARWGVEDPNAPAGAQPGPGAAGPAMGGGMSSIVPTDDGFQQTLQQKLQEILGGPGALDRNSLLKMIGAQQ